MDANEWRACGRLFRPDGDEPLASIDAEIWIKDPHDEMPGKWGGTFTIKPPINPALHADDFEFILELDDGRRAGIFSELDLESGTGTIDGNGPPPA